LPDPGTFIHQADHIALGIGKDQVEFIKARYEAMKKLPLFDTMELALDRETQAQWAPLVLKGRDPSEPLAMTRIKYGTDVDFGALTKAKVGAFMQLGGDLRLFTTVTGLKKEKDGRWLVSTKQNDAGRGSGKVRAKFVFVGAGGWALLMLQKAKIPEVRGYMALPVTGDWAVCQNPEVVKQHKVKVYAPGAPGAPPMSMPHLDYRTIGGKEMLLFGPFGSITFKFLRFGSNLDAIKAMKIHNIWPTMTALSVNLDLAVMLLTDVFKSGDGKLKDIRHYYPDASPKDWTFVPAGVRAQIIKKDPASKVGWGTLQFGTELVGAADGTIVGLLGASPGASTCVSVAISVLEKCFGEKTVNKGFDTWKPKLQAMIPSYAYGSGVSLQKDQPSAISSIYSHTDQVLKIARK